jgi:hypothetical protein
MPMINPLVHIILGALPMCFILLLVQMISDAIDNKYNQ